MSSFVPAHASVTAAGAAPSRWMLVLHGILGSGANWRTFARRLATARPGWGFLLVDLRMHGQSQDAPPPHTLDAVAEDLVRLEASLGLPVAGVMGHSFGGKAALVYAARRGGELDQVWVLDASPGTRRDRASTPEAVVRTLRTVSQPLPSRERFLEIITAHGHSRSIADWLAMNLRRADDGFRLRLDLDAIEALLDAYFATDAWPVLERARAARELHVVVGALSPALDEVDRARLAALAAREPRVHPHLIAEAGHWVHVDAPDALFELVSGALG